MDQTGADHPQLEAIRVACDRLPTALYLLSARHGDNRAGILVAGVQLGAADPILLTVPVRAGHRIDPLIRDSHMFALSAVRPEDRAMRRRFELHLSAEEHHDPFDALPVLTLETGAPIL
ncbi:MAG: flavin reductase, partial [Planctomycetota bacterium]